MIRLLMGNRLSQRCLIAALATWFAAAGCNRKTVAGPASRPSTRTASAPAAARGANYFQIVIYLSSDAAAEPVAEAAKLHDEFPEIDVLLGTAAKPVAAGCCKLVSLETAKAPPPTVESLKYFGRGLTQREMDTLKQSKRLLLATFYKSPPETRFVRRASELMLRLAQLTGGVLWDEDSREMFSNEEWKNRRLDSWEGEVPDVSKLIAVHTYKTDESGMFRMITLGMRRFHCPDVVVTRVPPIASNSMLALIDLVCQEMVERGAPSDEDQHIEVDIDRIAHREFRESLRKTFLKGASGRGIFTIAPAEPEQGDPHNSLIELTFANVAGNNAQERQVKALAGIFGSREIVSNTEASDAEIGAATARARAKLPAEKEKFLRKLPLGERLDVKVGFKASGGSEFMWVEVTRWKENQITGILANEPENVPGLHAGATVTVREDDVVDYVHFFADGTSEGNESGKVFEKREQLQK